MNRNQLTWVVSAMVVWAIVGNAYAVQTTVRLDVVTPDPNDPNYTAPLIEATGGQPIAYAITAIVETDDANYLKGLAAAYVTLNTNLGDANLVHEPNGINATLGFKSCTGLLRGDDVTDIGGSQRLLGESPAPSEFGNGVRVTIAEGQLTAPSEDGIYHVWVTPQEVRILDANVTEPPYSLTPDNVFAGQGFFVVVGDCNYYTLVLEVINPLYGEVDVSPNLPSYPSGMEVTLTALPGEGHGLNEWRHYDTNEPFDANIPINDGNFFTRDDVNNPIVVTMNQNRTIGAIFSCSGGSMAMLPMTLGILGVVRFVRRRR